MAMGTLGYVLRWRTQGRRGEERDRMLFFFFFKVQGQNYLFWTKLVGFKMFWT